MAVLVQGFYDEEYPALRQVAGAIYSLLASTFSLAPYFNGLTRSNSRSSTWMRDIDTFWLIRVIQIELSVVATWISILFSGQSNIKDPDYIVNFSELSGCDRHTQPTTNRSLSII